ncbi:ASKHA domain-containing protein [Porticoccus sp. W117]|uniref:ASKHA domain-containing protein n=1 Tax=Porticoccus sp. W117 TaxID=3054777 RepID=UPI002593885E|nr:ASKHA domain-containing protein [Porticoccus sp. W117]MDM3871397.1 ASKHA domain-containing protein [Porticoccus sp. W117]
MSENAWVVFTPSGKRGEFPVGTPLLQAARDLGVDIDSVCGGRGICGRCQVNVGEGEFAKHKIRSSADSLSPLSEPEQRFARKKTLLDGRRLSCHTRLQGDVVIDVPPESQVHRQVVRKDAEAVDIKLDPVLHLYYISVKEPSMELVSGDSERILEALAEQWQLTDCFITSWLLPKVQPTLRKSDWKITVAVRDGREVVAMWPGFYERLTGIAVDLGSTTIAAHLCDLSSGEVLASAGTMNPQIRFGEDLMSRVSYSMMNPGGAAAMTKAVRVAIAGLFDNLLAQANVDKDSLLEVALVANPIMHHLLLGIDPVELGGAPFALAVDGGVSIGSYILNLGMADGARMYLLPCIAGHVGADTAGMVLSEAPQERDCISLLVDVGTNAEIVLCNHGKLYAASSPTGPAFEGAQISCGQRAAPGAIERFRIDRETLEPRYQIIGSELWSDQTGFASTLEGTGVTGLCGSGIIEAIAELYLSGIIDQDGVFDVSLVERYDRVEQDGRTCRYRLTDGERPLYITQNDIRAIQLAKAALYAGIKLLMSRAGVDHVDRIRLAGAFGAHIDVTYAMVLGLIPDCDLSNVSAAGNAAGTGARIALLSGECRRQIESQVKDIEKVETALAPEFQQHFVEAMAFPHKTDSHENLEKVMTLPVPKVSTAGEGRRRRRKRG